jgi:hypothetical protein
MKFAQHLIGTKRMESVRIATFWKENKKNHQNDHSAQLRILTKSNEIRIQVKGIN